MAARRPLHVRVYRLLLRAFPAEFRDDFAEEMSAVFEDQRRDAGRNGIGGIAELWWRTAAGILSTAIRQHVDALAADLRYAVRMMRKAPGTTAVVVILLAVGIGANAAVFGLIDVALVRPLPVPGGDQLVRVRLRTGETVSYANYADLRDRVRSLSTLAAHQYAPASLGDAGGDAAVGELVTGNYFDLMRVSVLFGRPLSPEDDRPGAAPVIVLGHGTWRSRFGGDPSILGRPVSVNGHPFTVIGIAPAWFTGSYGAGVTAFWAPVWAYDKVRPRNLPLTMRGWGWLLMTGRLRDGIRLVSAQDEIQRVFDGIRREHPSEPADRVEIVRASGVPEGMRGSVRVVLLFSMAVVAAVLLVMCVNIAGVLHARMLGRRNEIVVRLALGASRRRIVRQWLTEHLLLAAIATAAGLLVARGLWTTILRSYGPEMAGPELALSAGPRVFAFTATVSLGAALLSGLVPTLRATGREDRVLRETASSVIGGKRRRARGVLTAAQVSASIVLLVAAGLLIRSLRNAEAFDIGFPTRNLALAAVDLQRHGYTRERELAFYTELAERLRADTAVEGVTWSNVVPLGGSVERLGIEIDGVRLPDRKIVPTDVSLIGNDYFSTVGIRIVRGRPPAVTGAPEAVVNESFARRYWPDRDPIGRRVRLDGRDVTVVGVARDIKYYALTETPRPYVYFPVALAPGDVGGMVLHVRVMDVGRAAAAVRREAAAIDRGVAVATTTFDELRRAPMLASRIMSAVSASFGVLALLLTVVGLYGTASRAAIDRSREIAVRIAFGADRRDVLRMILRQALTPVAVGIVCGLTCAGLVAPLLERQLFGVGPLDPSTYVAAVAALAGAAAAAVWFPARRATLLDPIRVLRAE